MRNVYEARILRVLDHIHANPAGDLSLDALADVAAMSRFHWHRVFRAMTGETCAEAVRRIRLHRATFWLIRDDLPVAEVAARAGYPNVQSFTRIFRERHGLTPAAFRRQGILTSPLNPNLKGDRTMFAVTVTESAPPRRLFGVLHVGPYMEISRSFEKLSAVINARQLWPHASGMVGVYYDDPSATPAAALKSLAGLVVDDTVALPKGLEEARLPGGKMAVLRFKGHYSGLPAAYDYLYGVWLPASGQQAADAPPFEDYINNPMDTKPEDLLTDICVPLQ